MRKLLYRGSANWIIASLPCLIWVIRTILLMVIMVVRVGMVVAARAVLTGRLGPHSTAGLAGMSAAILPVPQLGPVIGDSQPELGDQRRLIGGPVGEHCAHAGP
jgi:hypothetical protein